MADFCAKCSDRMFGDEKAGGCVGLCEKDEIVLVLCESCGYVYVDYRGNKIEKRSSIKGENESHEKEEKKSKNYKKGFEYSKKKNYK